MLLFLESVNKASKSKAKIKVEANDEGGHRSQNWRKTYQLKMCIKHQKNAFKDLPALLRDGSRSGISFMAMSDTLQIDAPHSSTMLKHEDKKHNVQSIT